MLFALLYLVLRRLFGLAEGSKEDQSKDVEILVLRHQLKVLRRQAGRPRLRRIDRAFLAAASRALRRPAWASFVVSPQTLLRWHRELRRAGRTRAEGRPRPLAALRGDRSRHDVEPHGCAPSPGISAATRSAGSSTSTSSQRDGIRVLAPFREADSWRG